MESMSTAKIVLFQGSTELRRCENCVFFLPVNILTGVTRRLLGPHDTLPCVLMLEKIQHRATKLISQLANLPYQECIQNLNIYSLYCRRECGDLIETFKILKQHLVIDSTKLFTLSPINCTRGYDNELLHTVPKK